MGSGLKRLFKAALRIAPRRFKIAAAEALLEDRDAVALRAREMVNVAASHLGITGLRFAGNQGEFIFAPSDDVLSVYYAKDKSWAADTNEKIASYFSGVGSLGTLLDIGANVGLTTIPTANRFEGVACHSFEPEPRNVMNFKSNVAANCIHSNVTLHEIALYDREDALEFEISDDNHGDHRIRTNLTNSIAMSGEDRRKIIVVKALPLDALGLSLGERLAVKIDVQGAEPFVIGGGRTTLAKAELLIFEWWPYSMQRMGGDHTSILQLAGAGFAKGEITSPLGKTLMTGDPATVCTYLSNYYNANVAAPDAHVDVSLEK